MHAKEVQENGFMRLMGIGISVCPKSRRMGHSLGRILCPCISVLGSFTFFGESFLISMREADALGLSQ
jgi:hypothetical protein